MPDLRDYTANARKFAVDVLLAAKTLTADEIRRVAGIAAQSQRLVAPDAEVDVAQLTAELLHLFSVSAGAGTALDDPTEHIPWLPTKRAQIQWRFWKRYESYLVRDFAMAPASVRSLDSLTHMVLERLEDAQREPPWDRRGMVVGSVQSGKTANYIGLICKALDAGYKLVIVLAGIHSSLRAQTQLRIDEGILGFDTQKSRKLDTASRWVGVGLGKAPSERLVVHSLTSSAENGDFSKSMAEKIGVMLGGDPVILVVKKNSRLLGNLLKWILHVAGAEDSTTGKSRVRNVPLLLIDDEADNASINTKAKPGVEDADNVTAINGKMRMLLDAFEKSAYVGYTATPFANIFINPEAETPEHGEDLFPRSFIISVKAPSNYVGPARVFGLDGDPDAGIVGGDALPVVRDLDDYATAFPPKHKKEHVPLQLPASLKRAIRCFVLTCAGRRARGQDRKHNSMLVHVTRFVSVQLVVVDLIREELDSLKLRIEMGDGSRRPTVLEELRELWEQEFVPVTAGMGIDAGRPISWTELEPQLFPAVTKIDVLPINGLAKEALDYKEHEADGRSVIAVGGDKLSRGLTLEGLSVSYFLRTSRMYDTLMQMGRWFGYRPGYLDLCRLFTTRTLSSWYRHIALAEEELRREFDYMVAAGLTPKQYGLRVRTHPDGMIVTALNKMSHGRTLELSWAGVLAQTTQLPKDPIMILANLRATEELLTLAGTPGRDDGRSTRLWENVPSAMVADYIKTLKFPPGSARASVEKLAAFIGKQADKSTPELSRWTVALVSHAAAAPDQRRTLAGLNVGLIERNPEDQTPAVLELKKANILNPKDEAQDFTGQVFNRAWFAAICAKRELAEDVGWLQDQVGLAADVVALNLTRRWQAVEPPKLRKPASGSTTRPNGRVLRVLRPAERGLLLIYPILPPAQVVRLVDGVRQPPEPTGMAIDGPPIIGVALSFPTSQTAIGVEYRVNPVFWDAELQEDADYED